MKEIILSGLVLFTSLAHASQNAKTAWQTLQNQSADMQKVQISGVVANTEISRYLTPVIHLSDSADGQAVHRLRVAQNTKLELGQLSKRAIAER